MEDDDVACISVCDEICAFCLHDVTSPKSLPTCGHSFCAGCLNDHIHEQTESFDTVVCPTCNVQCSLEILELLGSPTSISETHESIQTQASNSVSKQISDMEESAANGMAQGTSNAWCVLCQYRSNKRRARYTCINCENLLLCNECETSHLKQRHFSHHKTRPLVRAKGKASTCIKHGGRGIKFLCKTCDQPICEICSDLDHERHDFINLSDLKEDISEIMTSLHTPLTDILKLEDELKAARVAEPLLASQIISHADGLKKELDKSKDDLLSDVAKYSNLLNNFTATLTSERLKEVIQRGDEMLQKNITSAEDLKAAMVMKDDFLLVEKKAQACIREMKALFVPEFTRAAPDLSSGVGFLVNKPMGQPGGKPQILDYECQHTIEACYRLDRAVGVSCRCGVWLAFLGKSSYKSEFMDTLHIWNNLYGTTRIPVQHAIDIIGLDGRIDVLGKSNGWYSPIKTFELDYDNLSPRIQISNPKTNDVSVPDVITMTTTKNGNYVLLSKSLYDLHFQIHIVKIGNSCPIVGPLILGSTLASFDLQSLRIHCLKSVDLIVAHDDRGKEIAAFTFEVSQKVNENLLGRHASQGQLHHYLAKKPPILPPVEGYYIVDVCCDTSSVYFALKKRNPGPSPVKFYKAAFVDECWMLRELLLIPNRGKYGLKLKENELVKLGVYDDGRLACMVYSPTPLSKLKEAADPAMNVAWYTAASAP